MASFTERARETILRAGLVRLASAGPEVKFKRSEIFEGTEKDLMVSGSIGWQYSALASLRHQGLITSSRSTRGYQRAEGEGVVERLLALSKESDLQRLWHHRGSEREEHEMDEHDPEGGPVGDGDVPAVPDSEPPPRGTYSMEEKVDMLMLLLPKIAARLGDVAEALRTYGVTPDLREAILDSQRILKELES
jgi:hypothetical protein